MAGEFQDILANIESWGGSYVWDGVVRAVNLLDVAITETQAMQLCNLEGVQQVAINPTLISDEVILSIAKTSGIKSLVMPSSERLLSNLNKYSSIGPEIVLVEN